MSEHDAMVEQSIQQKEPARARASDFSVKSVAAKHGQSGVHGTAEGGEQLVMLSENQCGPRHAEDGGEGESGAGTPAGQDRGATVAKNFPIEMNKGEGEGATSLSIKDSVDLKDGCHHKDGKVLGPR